MTALRRFSLATVSVAAAALALAGCGAQQGGVQAGGGPAGGTATSSAPPTQTVPNPSGGKTPGAIAVRVDGVIERGVEPGCYVLTTTGGGPKYLVVSKTPPPVEVPVHVEGTTMPGTMSYCQQGTPLHVTKVEPR